MNFSSLSFTSKIRIVNNDTFSAKRKFKSVDVDMNDCSKKEKDVHTYGVATCISGGVNDKEEAVLFHSGTLQQNLNQKTFLEKINNSFKDKSVKLQGLIAGGHPTDTSSIVLKGFLRMFLQNGVKPSVFFAQNNFLSLIYSGKEDTWYLNIEDNEDGSFIETPQQLKDYFDFISISENDQVYMGMDDNEVDKAFLNKNTSNLINIKA